MALTIYVFSAHGGSEVFLQFEYHKVTMFNEARQSVTILSCGNRNGHNKYFISPPYKSAGILHIQREQFSFTVLGAIFAQMKILYALRKTHECKYFLIPMRGKKKVRDETSVKCKIITKIITFDFLSNESREMI